MKTAAFWVVPPSNLVKFTDVSEMRVASIIRVVSDLKREGSKYL
jgi:hypothetical protein